ncbi:MAG TPA: polyprenyl diphosphate synthase [Burkholderiaceae bacterium]|mgnify:CR=1 FL=1|nr:polyprenyl diphosphate synthase [Burkholderiaceae bacterium]
MLVVHALNPSAPPQHVAVIMDGNGRWAAARGLPRTAGHHRGVDAVRGLVEACAKRGVQYLTLFSFSSENWRRPAEEVSLLMRLFMMALEREVDRLREQGVRLRVVGDVQAFDERLQSMIDHAQRSTAHNQTLHLTICASYGGRWDIAQAARRLVEQGMASESVNEDRLSQALALSFAPDPDLLIRTGGETRLSNFLLWQLAYTELYFTDTLWPDFDAAALDAAFKWFAGRERRFGRTSEQLQTV